MAGESGLPGWEGLRGAWMGCSIFCTGSAFGSMKLCSAAVVVCFLPRPVDVWAIGSLITEMLTGEPLFPGDSDIDQLFHITKCLGKKSPSGSSCLVRNEGLGFVFMGGKITAQTVALTAVLTQHFSLSNVSPSCIFPCGCFVCVIPGNLIPRQQELFYKNPLFAGMKLPEVKELESLEKRYPKLPAAALDLAKVID